MKFEVVVTELNEKDIETIIEGARCGVSYWCSEMTLREEVYNEYKNEENLKYHEEILARALKEGNLVVFYDAEDSSKYFLTYDRLLNGVEKFINSGRCTNIEEIFEGNEDADDMDCIIQYALFDKIIFG